MTNYFQSRDGGPSDAGSLDTPGPWAPVVFTRTHHIDFRFLALPDDIGESERRWLHRRIEATYARINRKVLEPSWGAFRLGNLVVFGVSCWSSLLSDDFNTDGVRPMYGFFGGAFRTSGLVTPPARNLNVYKSLYQIVRDRYQDRRDRTELVPHKYNVVWEATLNPSASPMLTLHAALRELKVWRVADNDALWVAVANWHGRGEMSACLDIPRSREALEREVLNVTVLADAEPVGIIEHRPPPPPPSEPSADDTSNRQWQKRRPPTGERATSVDAVKTPGLDRFAKADVERAPDSSKNTNDKGAVPWAIIIIIIVIIAAALGIGRLASGVSSSE